MVTQDILKEDLLTLEAKSILSKNILLSRIIGTFPSIFMCLRMKS